MREARPAESQASLSGSTTSGLQSAKIQIRSRIYDVVWHLHLLQKLGRYQAKLRDATVQNPVKLQE
jgi:hypothetical protein